jgi:hypothetical protein
MSQLLPFFALQTALYDRLQAHPAMTDYADAVAENAADPAYPFTRLATQTTFTDASVDDASVLEGPLLIETWSAADDGGNRRAADMLNAINQALTGEEMTMGGFKISVGPVPEFAAIAPDYDDTAGVELRHGTLRLRFIITDSDSPFT